ncbi:MAG: class I adenylate-forming enzyme family protein [Bacteroidota bacterium]
MNNWFFKDGQGETLLDEQQLLRQIKEANSFCPQPNPADMETFLLHLLLGILQQENVYLCHAKMPESTAVVHLTKVFAFQNMAELIDAVKQSKAVLHLQTSGTGGTPKFVRQTVQFFVNNSRQGAKYQADRWALCYHPCHMAGLQILFQALLNANPILYLFQQKTSKISPLLHQNNISHLSATPTFFRMWLNTPPSIPSLQYLACGGERADQTLINRLKACFPTARIRNIFATTECGTVFVSDGEFFRISKKQRHLVRIQNNELHLHPSLAGGLANADNWHNTGDQIEWIDEARFRIIGRRKDILKVAGHKVVLSDIAHVLEQLPEVHNYRVFGRPNSISGQIVCCDVVARRADCSSASIRTKLRTRLQPYQCPRIVRIVDRIEISTSGKTIR